MRVGHFICGLNPFGTERVLESLLRYRAREWSDQFVVSYWDGPMRAVYNSLGVPVTVTREEPEIGRLLAEADLVNIHLLWATQMPESLRSPFPCPRILTLHWASPVPPGTADFLIATSAASRELQPEPDRCVLIPNGVDLSRFPGKRDVLTPRALLRVSRPEKCDESFWYAVAALHAEYPDTELWLAGCDGPPVGRVRPLGILSDMVDVLSQAYLMIHAPRPGEGAKDMAVMEAMAMGVPCIAPDVACVRESVGDGGGVVLTPPGDSAALAAEARRLLDDPAAAAALGARAREYALRHLDVRPRVVEYERIYSLVASGTLRYDGDTLPTEPEHLRP